jgi:hypothetical protein
MGLSLRSLTTRILPEYLPLRGLDRRRKRFNPARQGKDAAFKWKRTPSRVNTSSSVSLAKTFSQMTIVRTRGVTAATAILTPPRLGDHALSYPLKNSLTRPGESSKLANRG